MPSGFLICISVDVAASITLAFIMGSLQHLLLLRVLQEV